MQSSSRLSSARTGSAGRQATNPRNGFRTAKARPSNIRIITAETVQTAIRMLIERIGQADRVDQVVAWLVKQGVVRSAAVMLCQFIGAK
jgi:hypothetical protein